MRLYSEERIESDIGNGYSNYPNKEAALKQAIRDLECLLEDLNWHKVSLELDGAKLEKIEDILEKDYL